MRLSRPPAATCTPQTTCHFRVSSEALLRVRKRGARPHEASLRHWTEQSGSPGVPPAVRDLWLEKAGSSPVGEQKPGLPWSRERPAQISFDSPHFNAALLLTQVALIRILLEMQESRRCGGPGRFPCLMLTAW